MLGTTLRTTAWSGGPATSSRIDTTSWSGYAPTESVTPILTRWNGSIASASPMMATMSVMVAATRPARFPAEVGFLQQAPASRRPREGLSQDCRPRARQRIGEFWSYPQSRTFADLLIDCEEDCSSGRC